MNEDKDNIDLPTDIDDLDIKAIEIETDDYVHEEEESFDTSEQAAGDVEARKASARRNLDHLEFAEAREVMRAEMLTSTTMFYKWWDTNKPKTIPHFPHRTYDKRGWTDWNDFLGTNNTFGLTKKGSWRPITEAMQYAHKLRLKSRDEWFDHCRNSGELPSDIPTRPDIVYNTWTSWNYWLGNKPGAAIEARKEISKVQVFYLIRERHNPGNIISFGVEVGLTTMKQRWQRDEFDIVQMFWYEAEKAEGIRNIVNTFSSPYLGDEKQRLTPNVWEVVFRLQQILEKVTSKDVQQ